MAKADGSLEALRAAEEVFTRMPRRQRDTYTYTVMMALLGRAGLPGRALEGLEDARQHGVGPNMYMYNAAIGACAAAGLADKVPPSPHPTLPLPRITSFSHPPPVASTPPPHHQRHSCRTSLRTAFTARPHARACRCDQVLELAERMERDEVPQDGVTQRYVREALLRKGRLGLRDRGAAGPVF